MTTAIATQLKSINETELIELSNADVYWHKIYQIIDSSQPIYLLFPQTIEALAEIVRQASQHQWRILICGHASKLNWGKITQDIQLVVSTQKCDRLIEHAMGDLTVTVEAGMKLADLQSKLRSHNQFLPIDSPYANATLGGIVATADTGSWRQRYGGVRDLLLGLSFVRADGKIAKAGGRVVKNVAGYDLMKLFTGAYGTLGVITQLTFRLYPLMANSQTMLITGKAEQIAQATQTIRNSGLTPTAMDLLSATVIKQLDLGSDMGLMLRWQTIPESIEQQISQVKAIAQQLDLATSIYQDELEDKLWKDCGEIISIPQSAAAVTCKIGIAPAVAVGLLQIGDLALKDTAPHKAFPKGNSHSNILTKVHASSGLGQLQLNANYANYELLEQMRSHCQQNQGFLTILDAPPEVKQQIDVWGYSGNAIKTMKGIKDQFDPQNILNPGRFIV
ncbi:MAG: FAD-binding oxidoreductase [Pleurocapsa sp. SU_5_0]|nr:FAD-binding oxidoreductase [Pleurocapsa sp. SU_5_0]NJO98035.1 FAD-binding oxidoreductase [Pleurocapsa sp. CRU_1_2]NJR48062.1 FAD-binding oxidoreductase [Hyellaceae cyanobacterium CSU_1_1]